MAKSGKGLFPKLLAVSVGVILLNFGVLFFRSFRTANISGRVTENVVRSALADSVKLSISSKIFLVVQLVLITGILVYTFVYERKMRKAEKDFMSSHMEKTGPNETDLDVLYEALKNKKKFSLSAIANSFKINREVAMEWCKILESGDLAVIEYPGFGEPVIKIKENKE